MMMYGVGITPPIDVDAHTPLLSRAIDWCYDQRLTLRHCFCVLPLTTCFFILSLFYVLRLAYYIMPTDVSYTFVHKCLFLIMRFQFSIMHFSNLTYKVCKQFLLWSKACDRRWCVCVYIYGWCDAQPVHHHHVVQNGILGVCFLFVISVCFAFLGYFHVWCKKHVLPLACIFSNDFLC